MRIALALMFAGAGACFVGPFALLLKIVWQDRRLTSQHPDYKHLWGGKKLFFVALLFLGAITAGLFRIAAWFWFS